MDQARLDQLKAISERLGHDFKDPALLELALSHSSYVNEHGGASFQSNERLEFLGDAVLDLVISRHLYQRFPEASEAQLTHTRAGLVNERYLAQIAREMDLGEFLMLGRGERLNQGRAKTRILADAMEAVLAAIYLDGGIGAVERVIAAHWDSAVEKAASRKPRKDSKTTLQEKVLSRLHITPRYEVLASEGPDHQKTFTVAMTIQDQEWARGRGRSKKEAEQQAAAAGLELWAQNYPEPRESATDPAGEGSKE
jgi:ribonuclease-3